MEIIALTCPSCGAKLHITEDIERFACVHCGNEHIVQRSGGIVALKRVVERLNKISTSTDRMASELAISRLKDEIEELETAYKNACKERENVQGLLIVCLFGSCIGLLLLVLGLAQSTTFGITLGIIALVICSPVCYFGYLANQGWNKKCNRLLQETEQKNEQLRKHKRLVDHVS